MRLPATFAGLLAASTIAAGPPEFEAVLADDSTLKVLLLEPTVSLTTRYGKLTVPVADIRKIEFGFRYPPGAEAKAESAASDLGASAFKTWEEAEKTLLSLGEYAVPAVRSARKSTDPEAAKRADSLWRKLAERLPPEKLDARDYDTIEADFPVRGRVEPTALKVRSKYFGETELKLTEVRELRGVVVGPVPSVVTIDAAKFGRSGWSSWLDTGIDVSSEAALEILCTGLIKSSQQPVANIGPGGAPNVPVGEAIPRVAVNGPFGRQIAGGQKFVPGSVVGRIGAEGAAFLIGTSYQIPRAPAAGRLLLAIAPWPGSAELVGEFQVRIKVGN